jgi:hypothetical protein
MLFQVLVRKDDERGRQDAQVLIEAANIDEATDAGLEFARSAVFFGAKPSYVDWIQTAGVEPPFVMRVDAPLRRKNRERKRTDNTGGNDHG